MSTFPRETFVLRELAAPPGWTAALLEAELPLAAGTGQQRYAAAVDELRDALTPFAEGTHREIFLLFERCRPAVEIPLLQSNARWWKPAFGMGVWLHRDPPTPWSEEEFSTTPPGELRPIVERIVHLSREPRPQESAWRLLAGSGALLSVSTTQPGTFLAGTTAHLKPRIAERSLRSFPFYVPLLTAEAVLTPSVAFQAPLGDLLPWTDLYLRESVEDGGLLIVVRREPQPFWTQLAQRPFTAIDLQQTS